MALIIDESFEYRHKKFDQGKRPREGANSSGEDDEYIHVDIERVDDRPYSQQSSETNNTTSSSYSHNEQYASSTVIPSPPPHKRPRTTSFGSSTYSAFSPMPHTASLRNTSTPLMVTPPTPLAPTAAILPKISDETLRSICKYHGNMVRKFPKKERTPKDQERRNKNTIACRMSRRVKKLEHIAIEEQYKEFSQQTFDIIEQAMRSTAYLHELMKLSNATNNETTEAIAAQETETKPFALEEAKASSVTTPEKKSFTIAFLMGNED